MSKNENDSFEVQSRSSASIYERYAELQVSPIRGVDFSSLSHDDKVALLHKILKHKIHGISFSPDPFTPGVAWQHASCGGWLDHFAPVQG